VRKKSKGFLGLGDMDLSWKGFKGFAKGTKKNMTKAYGGPRSRRRKGY